MLANAKNRLGLGKGALLGALGAARSIYDLAAAMEPDAGLTPDPKGVIPRSWVRMDGFWRTPGTFRVGGTSDFELIAFDQTVDIPDVQNPSFLQVRYYTVAPLPYPPVLGWFMAKPGFDRLKGQSPYPQVPGGVLDPFAEGAVAPRPMNLPHSSPWNKPEQWSPPVRGALRPVVGDVAIDVPLAPGSKPVRIPPGGRPPARTKERKYSLAGNMPDVVRGLVGLVTESLDAWNAAVRAAGWSRRRGMFDNTFEDQWAYMIDEGGWQALGDNWKQFLKNLAMNELEDAAIGHLSKRLRPLYDDPRWTNAGGVQLGPLM